jgi:hypothetical protein
MRAMKRTFLMHKLGWICLPLLVTAAVGPEGMVQAAEPAEPAALADSTAHYSRKVSSKDGWEKVVSFPGTLINLPFKAVFESGEWAVETIHDSRIVPRTIDLLTFEKWRAGFVPIYASRSGAGMEFYARGFGSEQAKFSVSLAAGLRNRRRYEVRLKRFEIFDGRVLAGFSGRYYVLSDERFFGLGPGSLEEDESNYAHEQSTGELSLRVPVKARFSVGLGLRYDRNNILEGEHREIQSTTSLYTSRSLHGLESGVGLAGGSVTLLFDSKNHAGNPSDGMEIRLAGEVMGEVGGDRFGFWRVSADVTRYIHLVHNRTLVLRLAAQATEPFSNREIPFYQLSELGSEETIRGCTRGRFRDRDLMIGSLEYRYPIWRVVDALIFVDGGRVTSSLLNDFTADDMQWSFGGGIRIWGREGEIMTFQIGKGPEQVRVHLSLFSGE